MQDSFLLFIGVVGACAGVYLYADGREVLGITIVVLGLIVAIKTTRLVYRQFGPWRPRNIPTDSGESKDRQLRAEQRLKKGAHLGPGGRRSSVVEQIRPQDSNTRPDPD